VVDEPWNPEAEALALLDSLHTCTLATCSEEGEPHACNLLYAHDGFRLYWFSDPASRHSHYIDGVPGGRRVTMTVAGDHADFTDIRGLQMVGVAQRLTGPLELAAAMARLTARYGFLKQFFSGPGKLVQAMAKAAIYRFTAERVTLIDNKRGFGSRATFDPKGETPK
jgi:uncharacterized protein